MFKIKFNKWLGILILLLPVVSFAAAPSWKIVPSQSDLSFTATQNDSAINGKFTSFTGQINFDPDHLAGNNVKIVVDLASISDSYNQLSDTLQGTDWFNVKMFPKAIFQASNFTKTGDKTYQAKGTLTIRDKTLPVTLTFTQISLTPAQAIVKGTTTIQRTAFGVGQGQWADTKTIKDDVKVDFTVTATKQ